MRFITANFTYDEMESHGFPTSPNPKQTYLIKNLCGQLQIVRSKLAVQMNVTDCCRDKAKYLTMISKGDHPSETSDHFWGQTIPLESPDKIAQYGPNYEFSVGAIDFQPKDYDLDKFFAQMVVMAKNHEVNFGQLIIEESPTARWIHASNPVGMVYSQIMISVIGLNHPPFMQSKDGGISYQEYES